MVTMPYGTLTGNSAPLGPYGRTMPYGDYALWDPRVGLGPYGDPMVVRPSPGFPTRIG